jgi:hypothetical protein
MAINTHLLGDMNNAILEAAEGYSDNNVMQILAENSYNYAAIVRASIENDVRELAVSEEAEIQAIQEAGVGGFFDGLKEFFVKLGQKIKGMFEKVIAKVQSFFTSKKEFVKKYKDKFITNDLAEMKVNWRKPSNWSIEIETIVSKAEVVKNIDKHFAKNAGGAMRDKENVHAYQADKEFDDEKAKDGVYKLCLVGEFKKITPEDNFKKEAFDILFDSKSKETDVISGTEKTQIMSVLLNDKLVSNMEKDKKNNEKIIKDIIKVIDDARDEALKAAKDENGMRNAKGLSNASKHAHICGNLYSLAAGTAIAANKFLVQQSYSIFVKGVNFSKKNEETLLDAMEDVAFSEAAEELSEEYAY